MSKSKRLMLVFAASAVWTGSLCWSATVDLAIRDLSVTRPADASATNFTACSFVIFNYGPALNNASLMVRYYLSDDTAFDTYEDVRIGSTTFDGVSIAAGGKYSITLDAAGLANMAQRWIDGSVQVPARNYYVFAKVECNAALETEPDDNFTRTASTFVFGKPDFIVESISLSDTAPNEGQEVTATVVVKNQGNMAGNSSYLDLWRDAPAAVNDGDDGEKWARLGVIEAGSSETYTYTFAASGSGTKTFRAFIDSQAATSESDERNNQNTATYTVKGAATVDLEMRNLKVTRSANPSDRSFTQCTFDIYAYDGQPALNNGNLIVTYYLSSDGGTLDIDEDQEIGDTYLNNISIAKGGTYSVTLDAAGLGNMARRWRDREVSVPDGNYYVFAKVTCRTAREMWLSDNIGHTATRFAFSRPDFIIESISLSDLRPAEGQNVTATVVVKNVGSVSGDAGYLDFWVNRSSVAKVDEDGGGWEFAGTIGAGASKTYTYDFTVWNAGSKRFRAFIDSTDRTSEREEDNNQRTLTYEVGTIVDLEMRNLSVTRPADASARAFAACSFDIHVYSGSPALNNGNLLVKYYLSSDDIFGDSNDRDIGDTSLSNISIASGGKYPVVLSPTDLENMTRRWPDDVPAGDYYVFVRVTCSTAKETYPGDNYRAWGPFSVKVPAPPAPGYLCAPAGDAELTTVGTYDGYFYAAETFGKVGKPSAVRGTFFLKLTGLAGKLTAKATLQGGNVSFKGKAWSAPEADGTQRAELTASSGEKLDLFVRQNRIWGTLTGGKAGAETLELDGARNRFAERGDTEAETLLETFRGYYTIALPAVTDGAISAPGGVDAAPQGAGYLTVTIGNKGSAKIAGILADGTKVSRSSRLILFDGCGPEACVPLFAPLYSKKGWAGGLLWIDPATRVVETDRDLGWFIRWENPGRNGPDGFSLLLDACGGFYGTGVALAAAYRFGAETNGTAFFDAAGAPQAWAVLPETTVTAAGSRMTITKGAKPKKISEAGVTRYDYDVANPVNATFSFAARTGIFKGKFSLYCDYENEAGKLVHKKVSVPYAGVLTPLRGEAFDDLPAGLGYCLIPDNDPAVRAFRIKRSRLVWLEEQ